MNVSRLKSILLKKQLGYKMISRLYESKYILILLFMCVYNATVVSAKEIKGFVKSIHDNMPIENVTILVASSKFQQEAISDSKGFFSFEVPEEINSVKMSFSHVSFETKEIDACADSILSVFLIPKVNVLDEVVAKADWIYRKDGNTIVNVSQIPNAKNLQAEQILKYIPGIIKSSKGTYSLNGKSATIFINGIKQTISAGSLSAFLSSLPANAVSSIELVSVNTGNYSSSIEAIIDIKTNPNMQLGYSFQPYFFTSFLPRELDNYGGNLFYMTKLRRILFHNTLSYSNDNIRNERTDSLLINGSRLLSSNSLTSGYNNVLTYQGSLIYSLANEHTINFNTFIYNDFGAQNSDWQSEKGTQLTERKDRSDLYNVSVAYQIPSSRQKFNGTIAYAFSYGGQHSNIDYSLPKQNLDGKADLNMEGWMNTWSGDFKSSFRHLYLLYGFQLDCNSVWDKTDYQLFNNDNELSKFTGKEFLSAAYGQIRYRFRDRLSLRGGVRLEKTSYSYKYHSQNKESVNYTNLFPSLLFYYDLKSYNLRLGAISNIIRPKYEWMIPGERKLNDYIYVVGNPNILPTRTYGLVFYNTLFKYAQLNFSYAIINDLIGDVYSVDGEKLIQSSNNIADNHFFKSNMVLPFALLERKLTGQAQINLSYNKLHSFKNGFVIPVDRSPNYWTSSFSATVNYNPTEKLNLSIQSTFRPKATTPVYTSNSTISLNLELYYSLLKDKNLILSVSASNLFASDRINTSYFLTNQYHSTIMNLGPVFQVSLKWKLNKGQQVIEEYKDYSPKTSRLSK